MEKKRYLKYKKKEVLVYYTNKIMYLGAEKGVFIKKFYQQTYYTILGNIIYLKRDKLNSAYNINRVNKKVTPLKIVSNYANELRSNVFGNIGKFRIIGLGYKALYNNNL